MATVIASIKFMLSEQGRRDSLRQGRSGKRVQELTDILPSDTDIDAFDVNDDGQASFDATERPTAVMPTSTHESIRPLVRGT